MKKIFAFGIALLTLAACNMDFVPSDSMTSSALKENPMSAVYTTDGIYSLFKDQLPYLRESAAKSENTYIRHFFQLAESRSDNITVSGTSEDPFIYPYRYQDVGSGKNIDYPWWIAYKIIYAANSNISAIDPEESRLSSHLLGENYFFRAIAHFHMVSLFAMPYVCGRDNPGVPLRISMDYSETKRASVGEVYDAIVADLKEAIKYMDQGSPRGDASYVSATAARVLLSRVYLSMGDDYLQECIDLCNELESKAPASVKAVYPVDKLQAYPLATWSSPETIWCVHLIHPTDFPSAEGTIGAMYICGAYATNGWGEWYWSDELIELFNRYKDSDGNCLDNRFNAYFLYKILEHDNYTVEKTHTAKTIVLDDGKQTVCFPKKNESGDFCVTAHVAGLEPNSNGDFVFTYEDKQYTAKKTDVNGYPRWFIDNNFTGDATFCNGKTPAYIRPDCDESNNGWGFRGNAYLPYWNTKFSGQDGQITMSSPVFLRWAEVWLNRAEALARQKKDKEALDDVNFIRRRAGLPEEAMFSPANYKTRGYETSLDVVLDERRMEFCFEGQRLFDLTRNKKSIDRRYVGYHPFEVINYDDPRIALLIPDDEILSVVGYKNNPR